jgi:hypothetical protein
MRMRGVLIGVAVGTSIGFAASRVRRWWKTWGVEPDEAERALPGDEVVVDATGGETRGITIDAPPEDVWPWLLQMGYGRAGWYSYDQLDQRGSSAFEIVEAWQGLAVGDIVPTHPGGGFEVVRIDPGQALVLRSDTALVEAQATAAKDAKEGIETAATGVQASGAVLSGMPQQFAASWAFVLEPVEGGRTRLIERFRVWFGEAPSGPSAASRVVMPLMGFGVFVMMQKQMVGIRERAERLAGDRRQAGAAPASPPATNGHGPRAAAEELVGATS